MKNTFDEVKNRILTDVKKNGAAVIATAACLAVILLLFREICPSQLLFGIPCPGCGLTRAGILLLKGRFADAFRMHPFIYAIALYVLYLCVCRYIFAKKKIPGATLLLFLLIAAMVAFFFYRFALYFPDAEPMTVSKHTPLLDIRPFVLRLAARSKQ